MKLFGQHIHNDHDPWHTNKAPSWAIELFLQQEITMAAIDDLNTAVSNLATAVQALIDKVGSAPAGTPDAPIEAAVTALNDLTAKANTAATA
jgi:uncharacterized protein YfaQ (DUF2300 family)